LFLFKACDLQDGFADGQWFGYPIAVGEMLEAPPLDYGAPVSAAPPMQPTLYVEQPVYVQAPCRICPTRIGCLNFAVILSKMDRKPKRIPKCLKGKSCFFYTKANPGVECLPWGLWTWSIRGRTVRLLELLALFLSSSGLFPIYFHHFIKACHT